ncbi:MAG: ABC transporter permease [Lachnospiraceae bacterium]|nr:ABC transporter permease [Lachnospiraceae bacterium]
MNAKQMELMKKDILSVVTNRQLFVVMLIVPLIFTVVLPTIFILVTLFAPDVNSEFQRMIELLPVSARTGNEKIVMLSMFIDNIMPLFFMLIPIMASSVMAAGSFVGEKEKSTLETLLYSPLSLTQLFRAKIFACFFVGMLVSGISFLVMMVVIETELFFLIGTVLIPDISWLIVMLIVAPAISFIAISVTVRGSAKARTMEESQQRAVFVVFPFIFLIVGQFSGIILINKWIFLGLGLVLALIAVLLMKGSVKNLTYEKMLK